MLKKLSLLLLLVFTVLPACTSVKSVDPELRRRAANLPILSPEDVEEQEYDVIGEVEGVSCARQAGSNPSMEGARQELRINAAEVGADAIINTFCEEGGVTFSRNCWKTIQCRADAITWKEETVEQ